MELAAKNVQFWGTSFKRKKWKASHHLKLKDKRLFHYKKVAELKDTMDLGPHVSARVDALHGKEDVLCITIRGHEEKPQCFSMGGRAAAEMWCDRINEMCGHSTPSAQHNAPASGREVFDQHAEEGEIEDDNELPTHEKSVAQLALETRLSGVNEALEAVRAQLATATTKAETKAFSDKENALLRTTAEIRGELQDLQAANRPPDWSIPTHPAPIKGRFNIPVRALRRADAKRSDQLSILRGDLLHITDKVTASWFYGYDILKKCGFMPADAVRVVHAEDEEVLRLTRDTASPEPAAGADSSDDESPGRPAAPRDEGNLDDTERWLTSLTALAPSRRATLDLSEGTGNLMTPAATQSLFASLRAAPLRDTSSQRTQRPSAAELNAALDAMFAQPRAVPPDPSAAPVETVTTTATTAPAVDTEALQVAAYLDSLTTSFGVRPGDKDRGKVPSVETIMRSLLVPGVPIFSPLALLPQWTLAEPLSPTQARLRELATKWINAVLQNVPAASRPAPVADVLSELRDGAHLAALVGVLKGVPRDARYVDQPMSRTELRANLDIVVDALRGTGIALACTAKDIEAGAVQPVLTLLGQLMQTYKDRHPVPS